MPPWRAPAPKRASGLLAAALLVASCGGGGAGSIGAVLAREPSGELRVREAPDELSGAKAGLRAGDEIVAIDGQDVRGLSPEEIHQRLMGAVGTRVELTVAREGRLEKLSVTRGAYRAAPRR